MSKIDTSNVPKGKFNKKRHCKCDEALQIHQTL